MAKFACECGKELNTKLGLTYHQNTCTVYKKIHNICEANPHYDKNKDKYVCECGREFDKIASLNSHARVCDKYKSSKREYKSKIGDKYVCECGREFDTRDSYAGHASYCDIHHKVIGKERKLRPHEINHSMCWDKLSKTEIQDIYKRSAATTREQYKSGKRKGNWTGKHHSEATKQKLREAAIRNRNNKFGFSANYTVKACNFLDKLNVENNWHLQHALNGGEIIICGYYLDGYDKELNIVVEYDERIHYIDAKNNILKQKDVERQNNIIEHLNCKFYRYNEATDLLYEVHKADFIIYDEFKRLIDEGKINFTSKKTIKESIKQYSKYSYKSFLSYAKKHKEIYDLIYHSQNSKRKYFTHDENEVKQKHLQKRYIDEFGNKVTFTELKEQRTIRWKNAIILCCETSGIDFTKFGWSEKAKKWIKENTNVSFENTLGTFIRYYPEFIEKYHPFLRKSVVHFKNASMM